MLPLRRAIAPILRFPWPNPVLDIQTRRLRTDTGVVQGTAAPKDPTLDKRMNTLELQHLRNKGKKISMLTAYDYPSVIL